MKAFRALILAALLFRAGAASAQAPVCSTDWAYNFNVLPDGRVLAWNWSRIPAAEQSVDVWLNGTWVRALEVPALPANSRIAVIGVLRDVQAGDVWRVSGEDWCSDSGVIGTEADGE